MSKVYSSEYKNNFALVIGINDYQYVNPLLYARNDAEEVAATLIKDFDFSPENVTLLLDGEATKSNILKSFLQFSNGNTDPDDKIFIFYAGHGDTIPGTRGEIGFLIPVDGTPDDISTFIRWDELTRNSELFEAKHVLFVMDACYGGLAITRSLQPGNARFLKDMLRRHARQVLTAGKANEAVSDAGGPLPDHSIFTGHFLQGLRGEAAQADGIITANGLMSYVYQKVSNDAYSNQTPHYGYFDGDGDFIFKAPILSSLRDEQKDIDQMIIIPPVVERNTSDKEEIIDKVKEYLSEDRYHIKLDDIVNQQLRQMLIYLGENFPVEGTISQDGVLEKLKKYEDASENLQTVMAAIAYWGDERKEVIVKKIISRLSEANETRSGSVVLLNLRWYPLILMLYSTGISAIATENYGMLATLLTTKVKNERRGRTQEIIRVFPNNREFEEIFKAIPDHDRMYVPRSEYLFKKIQPVLDDLFFMGKSYEEIFDKFEVFYALVYADIYYDGEDRVWGPPGRFAWKHSAYEDSALNELITEAEQKQNEWLPLKTGLFGGSYERFKLISRKYISLIEKLHW
ncbi:caspase family protein [Paenibacillus sp. J22TS3]|uniref:caspase family protein n=1 Tax=Paenibacillus sp. J22TS3 TaxID=2807192 RepID=UPI001BCE5482|nr:caspase family protein [Paenibacillus sp. J22TS3]